MERAALLSPSADPMFAANLKIRSEGAPGNFSADRVVTKDYQSTETHKGDGNSTDMFPHRCLA